MRYAITTLPHGFVAHYTRRGEQATSCACPLQHEHNIASIQPIGMKDAIDDTHLIDYPIHKGCITL